MDRPVLITDNKPLNVKRPVLIIDKNGSLGTSLAEKISHDAVTVLVTRKKVPHKKNIIHIPFKRQIPTIPDNTYSHIIVCYEGESEFLDMLPALHKKAEQDRCHIAFVMPVRLGSEQFYKRLLTQYHLLSLLLTGDLFSKELSESNLVTDFLQQVHQYGTIVIPNSGLYKTFPIHHDDAVAGIIDAVFIKELAKRTYALLPRHPVTALSLARLIQSYSPLTKIDFHKTAEPIRPVVLPAHSEFLLDEKYSIKQHLPNFPLTPQKKPLPRKKRHHRSPSGNRFRLVLLVVGILCLLPVIIPVIFSFTGAILLSSMERSALQGNYDSALRSSRYAENAFSLALESSGTVGTVAQGVGLGAKYQSYIASLEVGGDIASLGRELLLARQNFEQIQSGKSQNPKDDFSSLLHSVRESIVTARILAEKNETPQELKDAINKYEPAMALFSSTSDVFPTVLGFNGKKEYLVLLQNNMELRPGGGFIGSYALVTLENGKMTRFRIHNVYDADGQMKGHVEPPYPMRRYMGIQHLYLRDSNFAVDFPKNAAQAAYFLELETKEQVDGVIGIDTALLRSLLRVTGPVSLPLYNETITEENFYLVTERHTDREFFPGSRQKQDFLRSLFTALETKMQDPSVITNPQLLLTATEAMRQKHLLIAVSDPATQNVLTVAGVSGALWDGREKNGRTINDSFSINEANLGENKGNYYVERAFSHTVTLGNDMFREEVVITYTNTSKAGSEFGGPYKAYVRVILPKEKKVTGIAIDGSKQELVPAVTDPLRYERASFSPPEGLEVEEAVEGEYTTYGFLLIVPVEKQQKVTISTEWSADVLPEDLTYSMKFYKQPGTKADPYAFSLKYPSSWKIIRSDAHLLDKGGVLSWFGPFASDLTFSTRFTR